MMNLNEDQFLKIFSIYNIFFRAIIIINYAVYFKIIFMFCTYMVCFINSLFYKYIFYL